MIGMNWVFHLLFLLSLSAAPFHAQASLQQHSQDIPEYDSSDEADLVEEGLDTGTGIQDWDKFFNRIKNWKKVNWGIEFGGVIPMAKNNRDLMLPASTQKVVTAIAALKLLGKDFRFQNSFHGSLDRATGTLTRAEFWVSGDPTWGNEYYDKSLTERITHLVQALKSQGVKAVVGAIQFVNTAPRLDEWKRPSEDDNAWRKIWRHECYAVVPTAVIMDGNCAVFKITGYKKAVWLTPGVTGRLEVNLSSKGKAFSLTPIVDDADRTVGYRMTGKVPAIRTYERPIHLGEEWVETLTAAALKKAGIAYSRGPGAKIGRAKPRVERFWAAANDPNEITPIDLSSPALPELLIPFVQHSINIVGDRLYLEIAYKNKTADAEQIVKDVITSVAGNGADLDGVRITDGSGLRLDNRMRAAVMHDLLIGVQAQTDYFPEFFKTLSVAGKSGTLVHRLLSKFTLGKVFGKTGTVNGVKNLVGYFQKADGGLEPFVFLTQTRSLGTEAISPMIDRVLLEFARQNLGLAPFSTSSGTVAKKNTKVKTAKK